MIALRRNIVDTRSRPSCGRARKVETPSAVKTLSIEGISKLPGSTFSMNISYRVRNRARLMMSVCPPLPMLPIS